MFLLYKPHSSGMAVPNTYAVGGRIIYRMLLACTLLGMTSAGALAQTTAQSLPAAVAAALKRAAIPASAVGSYVQEIGRANVVIAVNSALPMNPASTMKLVTSAAALDLLGPSYIWKTGAFITGTLNDGVLQGDLIFKGGGDPKLVLENFWLFLRQIRLRGIRDITGNVVLDRSAFADVAYNPATFDGDPARPYNAGPDALLLNYKALGVHFMPDTRTGLVAVTIDPPLAGVSVVTPQLSNEDCGAWQDKLLLTVSAERIGFNGKLPASCGEKTWTIQPYGMTQSQYFGAVFRRMWHDNGGSFQGSVSDGLLPAQARQVAAWESVSLPQVLRDMNKFSNNVMARQLLLSVAMENDRQIPATAERGAHLVKSWLAAQGIENPEVIIENGAGLSRTERISAGTMGHILVAAYQASTMPEFVSSLPLVGVDGTMRNRLQQRSVAGHAHIKTGSLGDVRAVAGYVQAVSGKQYVVVSLINHPNAARGQEAQDILLQWIYEHG